MRASGVVVGGPGVTGSRRVGVRTSGAVWDRCPLRRRVSVVGSVLEVYPFVGDGPRGLGVLSRRRLGFGSFVNSLVYLLTETPIVSCAVRRGEGGNPESPSGTLGTEDGWVAGGVNDPGSVPQLVPRRSLPLVSLRGLVLLFVFIFHVCSFRTRFLLTNFCSSFGFEFRS